MRKEQVGKSLHVAGYVALGAAGVAASQHPVIITLVVLGAGLFFLGRKLENPG